MKINLGRSLLLVIRGWQQATRKINMFSDHSTEDPKNISEVIGVIVSPFASILLFLLLATVAALAVGSFCTSLFLLVTGAEAWLPSGDLDESKSLLEVLWKLGTGINGVVLLLVVIFAVPHHLGNLFKMQIEWGKEKNSDR